MEMKKRKDQNRNIYLTLIVILVALAVAVAVTSVVGKKAVDPELFDVVETDVGEDSAAALVTEDSDEQLVFEREDSDAETAVFEDEAETDAVMMEEITETEAVEVIEDSANSEIPVFSSPASGYLINGFSDSVPVFSVTMNDYRTHPGVDIYAQPGEAVRAAADGVIGAIYEDPMMGTCMTVVHSGGAVSTYKGLYSVIPDGIVEGASVVCGQPIAAVGDTALAEVAEESHVHYELSIGGILVDPALYMDFNEEVYEN